MLLKCRGRLFCTLCTSAVLITLFLCINVPQAYACTPVSVRSVDTTDQSDSHESAFIYGQMVHYHFAVDNPFDNPIAVDLQFKISPATYDSTDASNFYSYDTVLHMDTVDPGVSSYYVPLNIPQGTSSATYAVQVVPYNGSSANSNNGGESNFKVQQPDLSSLANLVGDSPVTQMIGDIISGVDGPISVIPNAISCLSDLNQTTQTLLQGASALDLVGNTLYSCGKTALKGLLYILKEVPAQLESDAPELEAFMAAAGLLE